MPIDYETLFHAPARRIEADPQPMTIGVTQEDREAAEGLWKILGPWRMGTLEEVAEAFARHRQTAYEKGLKDGAAK